MWELLAGLVSALVWATVSAIGDLVSVRTVMEAPASASRVATFWMATGLGSMNRRIGGLTMGEPCLSRPASPSHSLLESDGDRFIDRAKSTNENLGVDGHWFKYRAWDCVTRMHSPHRS